MQCLCVDWGVVGCAGPGAGMLLIYGACILHDLHILNLFIGPWPDICTFCCRESNARGINRVSNVYPVPRIELLSRSAYTCFPHKMDMLISCVLRKKESKA